ncbi:MAG: MoaD/ThiS family protein [Deltaproteobacteria bacterium]|nr:MAG: MoaD/ThiS family protein [Deltaproteobacteria bacterium]
MQTLIKLKLFATLEKFSPEISDPYPVRSGATAGELIDQLNIPREQVKLIFINGVRSIFSSPLQEGDRVGLFPPVGGG